MKRASLFLFCLVISFIAWVCIGGENITDFTVARKFPQYPSTTRWKVEGSTGFPDGRPNANIYFGTKDEAKKVYEYYTEFMLKDNWKQWSHDKFTKKIGPYTYEADIVYFPQNPESQGQWWIDIDH